jgi:L-idonate 5-dehydrogenase
MKAALLHGQRDLRLEDLPCPIAGSGEVTIRVGRAGICGSDIHYFSHGRVGRFVPKRPLVLGHEFAGTIVAVGNGVDNELIGARVTVDPSMPCGRCSYCRSGRYNLCEDMRFFGSASCDPHVNGGFAEFVSAPVANCFRIPDSISFGEAAMAEPLSVALHAVMRCGLVPGKAALVTGGGTIGQLIALVLRAFGARQVVLSDIGAFPRIVAVAGGADLALDAGDAAFQSKATEASSGGFDLVFEASGAAKALEQGLAATRRGATIVQVGTLPASVSLPLNELMARELNLVGSFRFANVFATALGLVEARRVDLRPLISGIYPLENVSEAMDRAIAKTETIKVQLEP